MRPGRKDIEKNIFYNPTRRTWDCGICRKNFKERKDIEQHLNSSTHGVVRFSCAECGKGFASLGALTLHIEQAGHIERNKKFLEEVELVALGLKDPNELTSVNIINSSPILSSNQFPNSGSTSYFSERRANSPPTYNNSNQGNFSNICCSLWISGYSNPKHLIGAGCFSITNDATRTTFCQESFLVNQYYAGSIQPEYESLCKSMLKALDMNLRNVRIKTSNELLYLYFTKGSSLFGYTHFHTVDNLIKQAQQLFTKFNRIDIDYVPSSTIQHLYDNAYDTAMQYISTTHATTTITTGYPYPHSSMSSTHRSSMSLPTLSLSNVSNIATTRSYSPPHTTTTTAITPVPTPVHMNFIKKKMNDTSGYHTQQRSFNTYGSNNNNDDSNNNMLSINKEFQPFNTNTTTNGMISYNYTSLPISSSSSKTTEINTNNLKVKPFRQMNLFDMDMSKLDTYTPFSSTTTSTTTTTISSSPSYTRPLYNYSI